MREQVVIMNFSHVYEGEVHLRRNRYQWIDCTKISGTDCYLDGVAEKELEEKIKELSPEGIHFIDSGNYHYVSKLWTDKIKEPFSLIVFDHHTDMQPSMFEGLMSCGCWVKEVLDTNLYIEKVILIGAKEELIEEVDEKYLDRLICFSEQSLMEKKSRVEFSNLYLKEPVYISVDKDVLSRKTVVTNWDQGSLGLKELERLLACILEKEEVIGIDICGEAPIDEPMSLQIQDDKKNDIVNNELLLFLERNRQLRQGGFDEEVSNY